MNLLFNILFMVLISSVFVVEYVKTKQLYILFGIPLMFYFFVIMPIIEKLNINKIFIISINVVLAIITLIYAYNGWQILKKS